MKTDVTILKPKTYATGKVGGVFVHVGNNYKTRTMQVTVSVEQVRKPRKTLGMLQMRRDGKWQDVARLTSKEDLVGARAVVRGGYSDEGRGEYRIYTEWPNGHGFTANGVDFAHTFNKNGVRNGAKKVRRR